MKIIVSSSWFLHQNLIEPLINLGKAEAQAKCNITVNIDHPTPQWEQWPKNRPYPTEEEFNKAEERYRDGKLAKEGIIDLSDWKMGFKFVMSTYARSAWWHYFFPEETVLNTPSCPDDPIEPKT